MGNMISATIGPHARRPFSWQQTTVYGSLTFAMHIPFGAFSLRAFECRRKCSEWDASSSCLRFDAWPDYVGYAALAATCGSCIYHETIKARVHVR